MAQAFERVALADLEDRVLDGLAIGVGGQLFQLSVEVAQGFGLRIRGGAALQRRLDEISGIVDCQA